MSVPHGKRWWRTPGGGRDALNSHCTWAFSERPTLENCAKWNVEAEKGPLVAQRPRGAVPESESHEQRPNRTIISSITSCGCSQPVHMRKAHHRCRRFPSSEPPSGARPFSPTPAAMQSSTVGAPTSDHPHALPRVPRLKFETLGQLERGTHTVACSQGLNMSIKLREARASHSALVCSPSCWQCAFFM